MTRQKPIAAIALLVTLAMFARVVADSSIVDFDTQIRPILSDRCFACHGPDDNDRQADLRFDQRESAMRESEYGERAFVVKPGAPEDSELLLRLTTSDEDLKMPPPDSHLKVSADEVELIQRWIEQGAEWTDHWAFVPVDTTLTPPELKGDDWSNGPIDKFILARLREQRLTPASEANRELLARRVHLDLTGLPPTLAQLDQFLNDKSPNAYEKLVDRLLASAAYGERMAVAWLDVARYADTHGYQLDFESHVWPYRDWVVQAFNENLPCDQFITWQLAGDLLPSPTAEQTLATAFNRLHRQTNEGGSVLEEFRIEYVADRVDTFGVAMLGLSVGCARCHDHKFDPISQKEYYQLAAFFDNVDESGVFSYFTKATPSPSFDTPTEEQTLRLEKLRKDVAARQSELEQVAEQQRNAFNDWFGKERKSLDSEEQFVKLLKDGLIGHFDFEKITPASSVKAEADSNGRSSDQDSDTNSKPTLANVVDSTTNAELHESPLIVPGKTGNALQLNGDNGFSTAVTSSFSRHDEFSFAVWIKSSQNQQRATIFHTTKAGTDAGHRGIELIIAEDQLEVSLCHYWPGNAIRIRALDKLPVDEWYHVTLTYDGSSQASGLRLYLNGKLLETTVIRDELTRAIRYLKKDSVSYKAGDRQHHLTVGYRFRDRGLAGGEIDELKVYARQLTPIEIRAISGSVVSDCFTAAESKLSSEDEQSLFELFLSRAPSHAKARAALHDARLALGNAADGVQSIMVMREMATPRKTYMLNRGAYDSPASEVQPGVIAKLLPLKSDFPKNRLGLARWLTDAQHPLTARVAVNRIWQTILGRGLVATQEDFGSQGGRPSHPLLLDYLSHDFVNNGWDTKRLVKQIVMSASYRQSSVSSADLMERDPENSMLARGPSRRLTAEMIRDGALVASGLLVNRVGGAPVKPYQPAGLWKESMPVEYKRDRHEGSRRRSLYSFWRRTLPPPSMLTFDAAKREVCTVRRQNTATPLQALVLLNDPQYIEAARAAAEVAIQSNERAEDQIRHLFRAFTSRQLSDQQLSVFKKSLEQQQSYFSDKLEQASKYLSIGDHEPDSEIEPKELASLSVVAQMMMNLDYFVFRR